MLHKNFCEATKKKKKNLLGHLKFIDPLTSLTSMYFLKITHHSILFQKINKERKNVYYKMLILRDEQTLERMVQHSSKEKEPNNLFLKLVFTYWNQISLHKRVLKTVPRYLFLKDRQNAALLRKNRLNHLLFLFYELNVFLIVEEQNLKVLL